MVLGLTQKMLRKFLNYSNDYMEKWNIQELG